MTAKTKALLFAIAMLIASSRAIASVPRSTVLDAPAIDRFATGDHETSADDDNALLVARRDDRYINVARRRRTAAPPRLRFACCNAKTRYSGKVLCIAK